MNLEAECGSEIDSYFRERKELYLDRANIYGEVMREIDRLAEEHNGGCCEWQRYGEERMYFKNCKFRNEDIDNFSVRQFKFCPYCGKKIKVVE